MIRSAMLPLFAVLACQWQASAQTVQLPSIHIFSYSGTVEVPDGGTMPLGGNAYSASNRSQRAGFFPGPVARSGAAQGANASISATIIDQSALDRQILGGTPEQMHAKHREIEAQRDRESRGLQVVDRDAEGKALVRHARSLYKEGRYSAARDSYEMAVSILKPQLRDLAIAEMRRVGLR